MGQRDRQELAFKHNTVPVCKGCFLEKHLEKQGKEDVFHIAVPTFYLNPAQTSCSMSQLRGDRWDDHWPWKLPHQPFLSVLLIFNLSFCSPLDLFHSVSIIFDKWCSSWKQSLMFWVQMHCCYFQLHTMCVTSRKTFVLFCYNIKLLMSTSSHWCLSVRADLSILGLLSFLDFLENIHTNSMAVVVL